MTARIEFCSRSLCLHNNFSPFHPRQHYQCHSCRGLNIIIIIIIIIGDFVGIWTNRQSGFITLRLTVLSALFIHWQRAGLTRLRYSGTRDRRRGRQQAAPRHLTGLGGGGFSTAPTKFSLAVGVSCHSRLMPAGGAAAGVRRAAVNQLLIVAVIDSTSRRWGP